MVAPDQMPVQSASGPLGAGRTFLPDRVTRHVPSLLSRPRVMMNDPWIVSLVCVPSSVMRRPAVQHSQVMRSPSIEAFCRRRPVVSSSILKFPKSCLPCSSTSSISCPLPSSVSSPVQTPVQSSAAASGATRRKEERSSSMVRPSLWPSDGCPRHDYSVSVTQQPLTQDEDRSLAELLPDRVRENLGFSTQTPI